MSTDSFSDSTNEVPNAAVPPLSGKTAGRKNRLSSARNREQREAEQNQSAPIDRKLIKETRDQIRAMVDEITALSQSECSQAEFYQGFLTRTTSALASIGGAVWSLKEGGGLNLEYQINLAHSGLVDNEPAQIAHGRLLQQLADAGEPELVQPNSGAGESDQASNPTGYLLVVGPLVWNKKSSGWSRSSSVPARVLRLNAVTCAF